MTTSDVIIVGAGLAGATASILLARQGLKVTLIDTKPEYPPLFRAEKIEPDQADLLRKFDLLEAVRPRTRQIREILRAQRGRVVFRRQVEQFGISYQDIVNQVRAQLPQEVDFRIARVQTLKPHDTEPGVVLADGQTLQARLVLLASGMTGNLQAQVGARKHMLCDELSLALGFVIVRADGSEFPFDAVTYRPERTADRVGYLTLFRIGALLRANFFVYWSSKDAATQSFMKNPAGELQRLLPGLDRVLGDYRIEGRVEACRIDLYRTQDCAQPGVVMLGDVYQSVCPTTGMGLSKVLTDVDVLCHDCVPAWFATPGMGAEKIAAFYASARKQQVDDEALRRALRGRAVATDRALTWQARRIVANWRWAHGA